jgi:hypothetical protein
MAAAAAGLLVRHHHQARRGASLRPAADLVVGTADAGEVAQHEAFGQRLRGAHDNSAAAAALA